MDRKVDMADEKYIEEADKTAIGGDEMSEHDRKVMTRKILLKLDIWCAFPLVPPPNPSILTSPYSGSCPS